MSKRIKFESNNLFVTLSRGTLRVLDRETNTAKEWVARGYMVVGKDNKTFAATLVHGDEESTMLFPITKHWDEFRKESRAQYAAKVGPELARRLDDAKRNLYVAVTSPVEGLSPEETAAATKAKTTKVERLTEVMSKVQAEVDQFRRKYGELRAT